MGSKKRIIVFGIDGGTWDLLKPLAERGDLPVLKRLMEQGAHGTLLSCIPCRSALSVVTFFTGKNPCKWGMLDFSAFDPDVVVYDKIKQKTESIWDILGKQGYRSAIINLPGTHPPTPTNGIMISGFAVSENEEYTYPKELKDKVKNFHAERDTLLDMAYARVTMESEQERLNFYIKNIKERYLIVRDIINDKSFDFLVFWLDESDAAQHVFWGKEKILSAFFKEIDNIVGDIVEQNPESDFMIFSDHGFTARRTHEFYPKSWLKKENYLKIKGWWGKRFLMQKVNDLAIIIPPRFRHSYLRYFYSLFLKLFPKPVEKDKEIDTLKKNWRNVGEKRISSDVLGIDWSRTVAANYDFWGIKIFKENLNRDYEQVREEIMAKMKQLKDSSGQNIMQNVWKREEIFKGPDIQKFPDIVYLPESKFEPTGFMPSWIIKKKTGVKRGGDHLTARRGMFLAVGPDIKKSGDIGEVNIPDVSSTILDLFGLPIPEDMDGKPLEKIYDKPGNF